MVVKKDDTVIYLNTTGCTVDVYRGFIDTLRKHVLSGKEVHGPHGFKLLKDPSTVKSDDLFIFVQLTNWGNQAITLAIDITNLYVVGYKTGGVSFFLKDYDIRRDPYKTLFKGTRLSQLPFGGRYVGTGELQHTAGALRENIHLGIEAMGDAIGTLSSPNTVGVQNFRARHFIVLIQMISEAVRFHYIEQEVVHRITSPRGQSPSYTNFYPNPHVLSLETNWDDLSEQIQLAGKDGKFNRAITLQKATGETYKVTEISFNLYADIAALKYYKPKK